MKISKIVLDKRSCIARKTYKKVWLVAPYRYVNSDLIRNLNSVCLKLLEYLKANSFHLQPNCFSSDILKMSHLFFCPRYCISNIYRHLTCYFKHHFTEPMTFGACSGRKPQAKTLKQCFSIPRYVSLTRLGKFPKP